MTINGARLRPRAGVELALLALLYVGYSAARLLADGDVARAVANAHHLLHLESVLHLDVERSANHLLTGVPGLALVASYWYSALHYVVTPAVLIWVYRRHALGYRRVRNALVLATATGLLGFVLLPMAPPRMLPGYVDVLATTSGSGWWGSDASAPKGLGGLTNELAAMPSLHVGWALWCAWVVFLCTREPLAAGRRDLLRRRHHAGGHRHRPTTTSSMQWPGRSSSPSRWRSPGPASAGEAHLGSRHVVSRVQLPVALRDLRRRPVPSAR